MLHKFGAPLACRAAHTGMPVHRDVWSAMLGQRDPMKRLRRNGGAPDILEREGLVLLSAKYNRAQLQSRGFVGLDPEVFVCLPAKHG